MGCHLPTTATAGTSSCCSPLPWCGEDGQWALPGGLLSLPTGTLSTGLGSRIRSPVVIFPSHYNYLYLFSREATLEHM